LENTVTGSSAGLTLALGNGARLQVGEGASSADVEAGPIKVGGSGGFVPVFLGQQELEPAKRAAGSFNGSDGNSVTVEGQDFLVGLNGTTGPLVAQEQSTIQVGAYYAGTLSVKGPLTVRGKLQQAITHSGTLAGTDYSQLSATEEIKLESGTFELFDSPCTPLTVGDIDTLITTGGALKGTFQGIPNGAVVTVHCLLGGTSPTVRINYTAKTVTATVLTSGGGTPPTVTKVSPTKGPVGGGTSVTITGTNFAGVTAVKFGSTSAATFKVNSASSITAVSPAEAAGKVDVTVTTSGGTSAVSSKDHFQFTPTVTKLSPNTGSKGGGTNVTVTGTGFGLGTAATSFTFGTTKGTSVNCTKTTECTVVSPAHAAGKVDVKATVNKVSSPKTSADQFTYV
jgi:hypothetical protein